MLHRFVLFLLDQRATREHDLPPSRTSVCQKSQRLTDERVRVFDELVVDLRHRAERAEPAELDLDAAFVYCDHFSFNRQTRRARVSMPAKFPGLPSDFARRISPVSLFTSTTCA